MSDSPYANYFCSTVTCGWWSIDVAFERLRMRIRYVNHVIRDLEEALAQRHLRCRMRSTDTGEPQRVPAEWWGSKISLRSWGDEHGVMVVHYGTGDPGKPFRGWINIWGPDFEIRWPADPSFLVPAVAAPKAPGKHARRRGVRGSDPPPPPPHQESAVRVGAAQSTGGAPQPQRRAKPAKKMTAAQRRRLKLRAEVTAWLDEKPDLERVDRDHYKEEALARYKDRKPKLSGNEYYRALQATGRTTSAPHPNPKNNSEHRDRRAVLRKPKSVRRLYQA